MTLWKWSKTAAANGTADSTCPFPEGMAPSAVNDGTRGMMAAVAKYRDDCSGAIVTGGAVNAMTVSSFQGFDTLAHLDGQAIAFSPNLTTTGAVTLNVDSLGAKPLRPSPGVDFIAGELILGTPYVAIYNNAAGEFYLRGFMSSPYSVPLFGGLDFWDTIAPNSRFIFPAGQAISRTTYAAAFARWGTTYGAGDGATTFNVPDKTERVSVMKAAVATRLTTAAGGVDGATMGATGGSQTHTLTTAEMPAHNHGVTDPGHTHSSNAMPANTSGNATPGSTPTPTSGGATINSATTGITINNAGSGNAHAIVQPTIVCNYIIRII